MKSIIAKVADAEIEKELQPIIVMLAAVAATFVSVYQKRFSIDTIFLCHELFK